MKTALLLISILMIVLISSCGQNKSGHLMSHPLEKVVVLSIGQQNNQTEMIRYKVKRINTNTVDFILKQSGFSVGDTLLYHFP
jgi:hypothetical protein